MSEFSEAPQSEISSKITPEVIPQQPEQLPRRNFFTSILDKFRPHNETPKPQETLQEPQNYTKIDRRKFLIQAGATAAGVALGGHLIRNVDAVNDVVINQLLGRVNEALAFNLSKDTDALLKYGEQFSHSGPLQFDVPQQIDIGNTNWTDEQWNVLKQMVEVNKQLLDDTLGAPAKWTDDETVVIVRDYLGYLDRNTEDDQLKAVFFEGDALSKVIPGEENKHTVDKINVIAIPELFVTPGADEVLDVDHFAGFVLHEMMHAYNQDFDYLPVMVYEGMAQMGLFRSEENRWKSTYIAKLKMNNEEAEAKAYEFLKEMNVPSKKLAERVDTTKSFTEFNNQNSALLARYYDAAGFLFYDWQKQHPDFFKEVRKKENEQYAQTQQKPTYDQWQEFGEQVIPGFKDWLNSHPLFTIKRS